MSQIYRKNFLTETQNALMIMQKDRMISSESSHESDEKDAEVGKTLSRLQA